MSSERKGFLLRLPPEVLDAVKRWADAEMRSLNGQIEWILRQALRLQESDQPPKSDKRTPRRR
ncbi:MAG: Arc family DNA-binding protein [Planctomycetota bacterium]